MQVAVIHSHDPCIAKFAEPQNSCISIQQRKSRLGTPNTFGINAGVRNKNCHTFSVRGHVQLAELLLTPEFERLTARQKSFVRFYTETRDADAAVLASYDCADLENARRLRYDLFKSARVLRVLDAVFRQFKRKPRES